MDMFQRLLDDIKMFNQISGIPLAIFRFCFGGVLVFEFGRLLWTPVGQYRYFDPIFHFKYPFFEWVAKGPDWFLNVVFFLGVVGSILLAIGLLYRFAAGLTLLCYVYVMLLDITFWNNHYYLYSIFLLLFLVVNANGSLSIDKLIFKNELPVRRWHVSIFQFQIITVYVFGALSKLVNPDWMVNSSMTAIMQGAIERNQLELSDELFEFLAVAQTYGGIGFDLFIGFILIYRRTFLVGVLMSLVFHLSNSFLLSIGSFPFAMIGTLVLFIPEGWVNKSRVEVNEDLRNNPKFRSSVVFVTVFALFQLLFPLRHFVYDGLVFWTGEGKLGAWHMMSGSTQVDATHFFLFETDEVTGDTLDAHVIRTEEFLTKKQQRTMGKWPFLIPQYAQFLKEEGELAGMRNVSVYADIFVSRNGHRFKPIVDPNLELTSLKRKTFGHNEWILLYAEEYY